MIRSDDIRESLMNVADPFEACRQLTDKANQAGGHDNITVLVIRFDGPGLSPNSPGDEPLAYRKYALPESSSAPAAAASSGQVTARVGVDIPPVSEEAGRESRNLKVGHTMVGVQNPLGQLRPATVPGPLSERRTDPPLSEEPIELPTTGLAPQLVGFMVVGALLLVAVMGFLLLR
jgi:protein phosphatase